MDIHKRKFHNTFFFIWCESSLLSSLICCTCWKTSECSFVSNEEILIPFTGFSHFEDRGLKFYNYWLSFMIKSSNLLKSVQCYYPLSSLGRPVLWRFSRTDVLIFSHISYLGFWITDKIAHGVSAAKSSASKLSDSCSSKLFIVSWIVTSPSKSWTWLSRALLSDLLPVYWSVIVAAWASLLM